MKDSIIETIIRAHALNKKFHPSWPDHPAGQAGLVTEQAGRLMAACLDWKYQRGKTHDIQNAQQDIMKGFAINTIVAAIRFIENLQKESNEKRRQSNATQQEWPQEDAGTHGVYSEGHPILRDEEPGHSAAERAALPGGYIGQDVSANMPAGGQEETPDQR